MALKSFFFFFFLIILLVINESSASVGDRSPDYRQCKQTCFSQQCYSQSSPLEFSLRVFCWTCEENCGYECMMKVTQADVKNNFKIRQFHGKWPFVRILGIQEPASVLFSLFNLLAHVIGLRHYLRKVKNDPMKKSWKIWAYVSCNAWFWSTIFHCRDLPWTEKLDYFSAMLVIVWQSYLVVVHIFKRLNQDAKFLVTCVKCLLIIFYFGHVTYLSFRERFHYSYHMTVNITIAIIHGLLWLGWCGHMYFNKNHSYVFKCVFVLLAAAALMIFEVADFPPFWFLLDAHAIWHLGTGPLALVWYSFLIDDALFFEKENKFK